MKLKTFAIVSALALMCTGILAGTALVITTDYLQHAANGIRESIESIHAAEELRMDLLLHNRSVLLAGLTGERGYVRQKLKAASRVKRLLADVREHVSTPREQDVYTQVELAIRNYFHARRKASLPDVPTIDAYVQVRQELETADWLLGELIQVNREQADSLSQAVAAHDRLADRMGTAVTVVILLGVAGGLLVGWQFIYLPVLELSSAIAAYAQRRSPSRVEVSGMREIRDMGIAFNEMAEQLERHKDNQLRFIASIAHDLRNPLGAIRMSSELLNPSSGVPDSKRAKIAELIQRQASQLDRLIGDLMNTARIEMNGLEIRPERHDARALVQEVALLFQAFSAEHRLETAVPDQPVWCNYDAQRMSQVLNNLVSNAIKYSPRGGRVQISAYRRGDDAVIAVCDEGIGIEPQDQHRIFEPFQRSAATRDTVPGVGLGLSVSRKIVETHGGHIELDSKPGMGTTFRVALPADAPPPA